MVNVGFAFYKGTDINAMRGGDWKTSSHTVLVTGKEGIRPAIKCEKPEIPGLGFRGGDKNS